MILIQARTSKTNPKTLRYNFSTFSLRDFMQDSFNQSYPPPPISDKKSRTK
ncbi:type III restriction endonuclease subunit R [Helicobacter pylori]